MADDAPVRLINAYDVWQAVTRQLGPVPVIWARSDAHYRFADGTGGLTFGKPRPDRRRWVTFAEAAAAWRVDGPWVTPRAQGFTGQVWFPASIVDKLETLTWDRTGKRVVFVEGVPCHVTSYADWSSSTCGRPATGDARLGGEDVPICAMHLNAQAKRAETDAKIRADIDAMFERLDDDKRHARASADWVVRLVEHGVYAEATGGETLRVKVKPEELYGLLTELAGVLRDVGAEWPESHVTKKETS